MNLPIFILAGIELLTRFHGFPIFLLLKGTKDNSIKNAIETHIVILMIYARYFLSTVPLWQWKAVCGYIYV